MNVVLVNKSLIATKRNACDLIVLLFVQVSSDLCIC